MAWQEQLNKAIEAIKGAAESETAQNLSARAKQTATQLDSKGEGGGARCGRGLSSRPMRTPLL